MKVKLVLLAIFLLILPFIDFYFFLPYSFWTPQIAYGYIKDIYHPSLKDYEQLQKVLEKGKRPELIHLKDMEKRCRNLKIIGKGEKPEMGVIHVNCKGDQKENCLVTYASFNKNFKGGLKRLIDHVRASNYQGDILYRIGGWPNTEEGDVFLAHIPFAFKLSSLREAKRLGYRRVLWLDASILPLVSLNEIFHQIEEKGYFLMGNGHFVGPYFSEVAAKSLGVSFEETFDIPSCSAGIFGLDLSCPKALSILNTLYMAAKNKDAFFSPRSDQSVLSLIMYRANMRDWASIETLADGKEKITERSLFLIDRKFVQKWKE